ncbi:MAG: DUF2723 domain-containing protein [Flavobacteriales bacterium]|nr:DUF2723 domain-containing protein [Flavobacteriales bacterium]
MKKFGLVNNVFGWLSFLAALIVYSLTAEESVSLWDCGEFISASYRMQVVHPPGAPLFLMIGRVFSLMAGNDVSMVAWWVNMVSVVTSALTVLFTFWIIVHFAKKILDIALDAQEVELSKGIAILGSGLVGAMSLTFMDSFWFSAVEAEVYASSSLFTALSFWCILKWERVKHEHGSDRWLILIAYTLGLAVGLHLLNLLVIPAVVYYYYFHRYKYSRKGLYISTAIGIGALGAIQSVILPGLPKVAAFFDRMFVNSLGMPFNSGVLFFVALFLGLLTYGIYYTIKTNHTIANLVLNCLLFVFLGYSSYSMVVLRSLADPAIDMNNPEDPYTLTSYINREQYGDRPLLYGPYYNADYIGIEEGPMQYRKGKDSYVEIGNKLEPKWDPKYSTFFPRMGDSQKEQGAQGYQLWSGAKEGRKPTFGQNMTFFFKYQLGYMYMRYFMWNFVGRQNDDQGMVGDPWSGNWLSGINFIDNMILGPQTKLPDSFKVNKARNTYFFLPLILGILGMVIQFRKRRFDGNIVLTLFLFTGVLIIVYLNQPPFEPRERDYSMVGSFQTFCIWIGLGVLFIYDYLGRKLKMSKTGLAAGITVVSMLAAPVLMAKYNWDDHDRSDRRLGISFAKNYLNSCAKNAILFTNGDNDTYPLWYAQNVEGIRTDVRIINLSLLGTDWYINLLRRKVYDSEPLDLSIPEEKLVEGLRDITYFFDNGKFDQNQIYPLDQVVAFMTSDNEADMTSNRGKSMNFMPVKKFSLPVDRNAVIKQNIVKETDDIVGNITFDIGANNIYKGTLVVLDILSQNAKNGWKRPIYFTTTTGSSAYLNLDEYFRLEGLTYRLVPLKNDKERMGLIDPDMLARKLTKDFDWGNMDKNLKMNLDDKATLVPKNLRVLFVQLARTYAMERNENQKAVELLDYSQKVIPEAILPMDLRLRFYYIDTYYAAKANKKAEELMKHMVKDCEQQIVFYKQYTGKNAKYVTEKLQEALGYLAECGKRATENGNVKLGEKYTTLFNQLSR